MGVFAGPEISESGLVLALDTSNSKSFDSRENLVSYSTYNASTWSNIFPAGATLTTGIEAPDGTNTAIRFSCNNTTNALLRVTFPSFTPNGTDTYTTSFYVRRISGTGNASTDLADGAPSVNYSTQLITNQWVRVVTSGVPTATAKTFIDLFSDSNTSLVLDFWGVQIEKNPTATTYTATSGSTIIRPTTWTDLSGRGNNGTLTNGPTYSSSNSGSIVFDGTNDYVSVPYTPLLTPTSQITFSAWAFLSNWNISGDRRILSKTQGGGYQIGLNEATFMTDGFLGALVYAGGAYRIVKIARSTISSGWHNLSFTFDGRYFRMYIDGSNVDTYDNGSTTTISYSTNNHFLVGAEPGAGTAVDGAYWNGNIAQVSVYNRALTASEIRQNFNALRGRFGI